MGKNQGLKNVRFDLICGRLLLLFYPLNIPGDNQGCHGKLLGGQNTAAAHCSKEVELELAQFFAIHFLFRTMWLHSISQNSGLNSCGSPNDDAVFKY